MHLHNYSLVFIIFATLTASEDKLIEKIVTKTNQHYGKVVNFMEIEDSIGDKGKKNARDLCADFGRTVNAPIIVLLQDKKHVLSSAAEYLEEILKSPNCRPDFWAMKFNTSGVSAILSKTSIDDINHFKSAIKGDIPTGEYLGPEKSEEGGPLFFSILKAVRMLPPRSAILIFTHSRSNDEDLARLAIQEAQGKEIRIYVVWKGLFPSENGDSKLIKEVTQLTHGNFLVAGNTIYLNEDNVKSIVAHQTNIFGKNTMSIPIDKGVKKIHFSITGGVSFVRLSSPNGYLIDLLNASDVEGFSQGSFVVKINENYETELNTAQNVPTASVGIWRLESDAIAHYYNITVSVQNQLVLSTQVININKQKDKSLPKKLLRLDLQGNFKKIDNITLINPSGSYLSEKIQDNLKANIEVESLDDDIEMFNEKKLDINVDGLPEEPLYIRVSGKDFDGNDFVRMSYFNKNDFLHRIQPVTIEAGLGSELLVSPGRQANIHFEVTSNKDQVVFLSFVCTDEKRILSWLNPKGSWINPRQTVIVTVAVFTRPGNTYQDRITFTAFSRGESYDKNVIMTIGSLSQNDNEVPHVWHKFTSDCLDVLLGRCQDSSWTIQVTAQDKESGLLQVSTSPQGLSFPQGYTSGTKEEVTGYLSGTCCDADITLTAVDLVNNRRSYLANAYRTTPGAGAISAIVLGILILIAIIVALICVFKCGKCRRKESDSIDLPRTSYRGPLNSASTRRY